FLNDTRRSAVYRPETLLLMFVCSQASASRILATHESLRNKGQTSSKSASASFPSRNDCTRSLGASQYFCVSLSVPLSRPQKRYSFLSVGLPLNSSSISCLRCCSAFLRSWYLRLFSSI